MNAHSRSAISKVSDLLIHRYCAIKLTKDWIVELDDVDDACYAATLLEWNTYKALHDPRASQAAESKDFGQETHKRKISTADGISGEHIPAHGAGHVSHVPGTF